MVRPLVTGADSEGSICKLQEQPPITLSSLLPPARPRLERIPSGLAKSIKIGGCCTIRIGRHLCGCGCLQADGHPTRRQPFLQDCASAVVRPRRQASLSRFDNTSVSSQNREKSRPGAPKGRKPRYDQSASIAISGRGGPYKPTKRSRIVFR